MGKAIYAKIADQYVQVDQSVSVPTELVRMPSTHCALRENVNDRSFTASIWLAGLETKLQTNRGVYTEMVEDLRKNLITEIPKISNQFVIYVDYTIYNEKSQEINHSCTTKRIEGIDAMMALGVAFNNECVYRRVKAFDPKITFSVTNHVPFGIMGSSYGKEYTMKINDICILQSIDPYGAECFNAHNSIEGNSYSYMSHTIGTLLKDNIPVYSTAAEKIDLGEFKVNFYPRKIVLDIHAVLANLIVAYDDQNIKDILMENLEIKYDPDKPVDPDPGDPDGGTEPDDPVFPPDETHEDADGNYEADANGFYTYYERCLESNPDSLLVVEDIIPSNVYDPSKMIRKRKVLKDIPDVEVGEYIRFTTGFDITKL